jgi:hypothetical protein
MDRRDARSRVLLLTTLVSGFVLGVISLSPVSANHTSSHTKKQIKGLQKQVNALKGTVGSLQASLTTLQGSLTSVQGTVNNLNSLQHVVSSPAFVTDGFAGQVEAVCPAGTFATGGGGFTDSFDGATIDSYPSHGVGFPGFTGPPGRSAWAFEWGDFGGDGFSSSIRAYVVCSRVGSASGNYTPGTVPFPRSGTDRRAWTP